MDADGIRQVLRDVFGRNVRTQQVGQWLSLSCPLAPYTHARGKDGRASAGISIKPNDVSIFNCYTCGNTAPFHGMLRKWAGYTGEDLSDVIRELEDDAYLGPRSLPTWDKYRSHDEEEQQALDPVIYMDLYDSAADHPYVLDRGISAETCNRLQLMIDPEDPADGEERILFPVFSDDGVLRGLSGRATNPGAVLKVRDYHGLAKARNLLGAHLITREKPKYIVLVEGLFDYARAWECGQPAVAVMHSNLTSHQIAILRNFGLPVYTFMDDDDAGAKGVETAGKFLSRYVPVMRVRYPKVWIEDESAAGGHWLKDPGEMLPEEFEGMIQDARLY